MTLDQWQKQLIAGLKPSASEIDVAQLSGLIKEGPQRVDIYRGNIKQALINALNHSFPTLANCIGKEKFLQLCHLYMAVHPPHEKTLNNFGHQMQQFIKQVSSQLHRQLNLEYLSDLAALDWLKQKSYYAKNDAPMAPESYTALAKLSEEAQAAVQFSLCSHLEIYSSPYYLSQHIQQPHVTTKKEDGPQGIYHYVVMRNYDHRSSLKSYHPQVSLIKQGEFQLIQHLHSNTPLGELVELEWDPPLQQLLFDFTQRRWLKGFELTRVDSCHV